MIIGKEYIFSILLLETIRIHHFLSLIWQGIPNRHPKIVFVLSAEHDLRAINIGSRIILDVDVVGMMDEEDWFITSMNCDSFG